MAKQTVSLQFIRECLDYDAESGIGTWRHRPRSHFKNDRVQSIWNTKYAGKAAGSVSDRGYLRVCIAGKLHLVHRLIFAMHHGVELADLPKLLDHKDDDRANNRHGNLRAASKPQNSQNRGLQANNTSGFKCVHWHAKSSRWISYIHVDGKRIDLGSFDTAELAHAAYGEAARVHFGEFARVA